MTANAEARPTKWRIDDEACIGCSECVACFTGAINISWKSDPAIIQQKMVEYAAAALHDKQAGSPPSTSSSTSPD